MNPISHLPREQQLAYAAGLMDGDGSWSIQVQNPSTTTFSPKMVVSLKAGHEALDVLQELFGGRLYEYGDDMKRWHLGTREELIATTQELLPYLTIKRGVAARFLHALSLFPDKSERKGTDLYHGETIWSDELVEEVVGLAKNLNSAESKAEDERMTDARQPLPREVQVAYAAGLMDSEGSWNIQTTGSGSFAFRLTMSIKYGQAVLDVLVDLFGGKAYGPYKDGVRRWSMGQAEEVLAATEELLPYLIIKKGVAERFLQALDLRPSWTPELKARVREIAASLQVAPD